jgi:hypothetical protein
MKKSSRWYGEVFDLAMMDELRPSRKLRKAEIVVPEPLPEWKPVIRVSRTVVKRVRAEVYSLK